MTCDLQPIANAAGIIAFCALLAFISWRNTR